MQAPLSSCLRDSTSPPRHPKIPPHASATLLLSLSLSLSLSPKQRLSARPSFPAMRNDLRTYVDTRAQMKEREREPPFLPKASAPTSFFPMLQCADEGGGERRRRKEEEVHLDVCTGRWKNAFFPFSFFFPYSYRPISDLKNKQGGREEAYSWAGVVLRG